MKNNDVIITQKDEKTLIWFKGEHLVEGEPKLENLNLWKYGPEGLVEEYFEPESTADIWIKEDTPFAAAVGELIFSFKTEIEGYVKLIEWEP